MANIRAKKVILKNRDGEHLVPITDVDALNYKNITNCLLEVPQRIKYTLADGVLTIKAGSQVIVPYGNHERDIIVVGSPTITSDGVASNFSSSNYIELKQTFATLKSGSEIVFNATLTGGADQRIICFNSYTLHFGVNASNLVKIWISSTGSSWDIANGTTGKTTLSNNVNYYFKVSFTGTAYKVDISTDGVTYNNEITINSSSQVYTLGKAMISNYPSGSGASATGYWRGSIDLSKSYIKNGSDIIWSGADRVLEKYPVGSTFLNSNFKVADTQYADGKFFVWAELQNDISAGTGSLSSYTRALFINAGTNGVHLGVLSACKSGTTPEQGYYYHTGENKMYIDTVLKEGVSLPLMYGEWVANTGYTSIDQVFNGMGYIGSTVWVDKGVKGLIPNGRNKDGTLKNIEFEVPSIIIGSRDLTQEFIPVWYQSDNTIVFSKGWEYVETTNKVTAIQDGVTTQDFCQIATVDMDAGVISNFQPKLPFHAVDYNDLQGKVSKAGDTMSGALELYGTSSHLGLFGGAIYTHTMDLSIADKPTGNKYYAIVQHEDKNMVRKNRLESFWMTDGRHGVQLSERKNATDNSYFNITIGVDANGNAYTYAPHCAVNNGIVTQAGISKAGNGYVKFGNGIIMQWGQAGVTSNYATVTFPTAFSSTARVTVTPYNTSVGAQNNPIVTSLSKTSFKAYCEQTIHWIAIGY